MTTETQARNVEEPTPGGGDVCSADHAGFLSTPLRRLLHNPKGILKGMIREGDTVVDFGCGPGFFTLPMAEIVGARGRVVAVDLQAAMLERLERRAVRRGLTARIRTHQCAADTIGEVEPADFALAFFMVHEVPDVARFLAVARHILKPGGRMLLVEPNGHVSAPAFEETVRLAREAGLDPVSRPRVILSRAALLERR
jgi:ubiquinone/menaquinone biosynthesis C-methylase UbiE